jgi:hypothetical protein
MRDIAMQVGGSYLFGVGLILMKTTWSDLMVLLRWRIHSSRSHFLPLPAEPVSRIILRFFTPPSSSAHICSVESTSAPVFAGDATNPRTFNKRMQVKNLLCAHLIHPRAGSLAIASVGAGGPAAGATGKKWVDRGRARGRSAVLCGMSSSARAKDERMGECRS